jgi:hypothetical protein
MSKIKIKSASMPFRCEICHQADCFDASKNYCSRCSGRTPVENRPAVSLEKENIPKTWDTRKGRIISDALRIASLIGMAGLYVGSFNNKLSPAITGTMMGLIIGTFWGILREAKRQR